jgi:anti-sigma factor ChrR (cupin superfamily)
MLLNADLTKRAVVHTAELPWTPSPVAGVDRKMLEREGDEVARATSLVRFAAGTAFPQHTHAGGEEFLVLEGTFCDESGAYAPGTYVRHPIGSRHRPFSPDGCVLLVKLRQMTDPLERGVVVDSRGGEWTTDRATGVRSLPLFRARGTGEDVRMEFWPAPGIRRRRVYPGGCEYYVIDGCLEDEEGRYPAGTWLRLPARSGHTPDVIEDARLWVKSGHLDTARGAWQLRG